MSKGWIWADLGHSPRAPSSRSPLPQQQPPVHSPSPRMGRDGEAASPETRCTPKTSDPLSVAVTPCSVPTYHPASKARFPRAAASCPAERDQLGAGHEGLGQRRAGLQETEQCTKHQGQTTLVQAIKGSRKNRKPTTWHHLTPSLVH